MDLCGERCLYYSLMAFWAVGLLMLIVQHPYDCKFFDLPGPGSGVTTPDNPHETVYADWFFTLTHQLTLTPYAIFCCLLQAGLFTVWFIQLSNHDVIQARVERETQRGQQMREAGWKACLQSVCADDDEEAAAGDQRRSGFRCVCGCCYCFSTACMLTFGNWLVLLGLVYLLLLGYGTLESTARSQQNLSCSSALPTGIYIYILNGCLAILWIVLLLVRCLCATKGLAVGVVSAAKDIRLRVAQRKGRKAGSKYAQLGGVGASSSEGDIELALESADDQVELDHDSLSMDNFLDDDELDDENEVFRAETHPANLKHARQLAQPKPHRSAAKGLATTPGGANGHDHPQPANGHGAAARSQQLDDDTREMLEMLGSNPPEPMEPAAHAPVQYPDDDEPAINEEEEDGI